MKFSFRPAARDTSGRRPSFEGGLRTVPKDDSRPAWDPSGGRVRVPSPRRLSAEIVERKEIERAMDHVEINRAKVQARKAAASQAKVAVEMARQRKRASRYEEADALEFGY